ncbi:hypothetical protein IAU59_001660 [Kwoniella sp. CBS 9459]
MIAPNDEPRTPPRSSIGLPVLPPTPPPTENKRAHELEPNEIQFSPSSSALSSNDDSSNAPVRDNYFGPMVLFDTSRQQPHQCHPSPEFPTPSGAAKDGGQQKREPLFLPIEQDDTEKNDDDFVMYTHEVVHPPPEVEEESSISVLNRKEHGPDANAITHSRPLPIPRTKSTSSSRSLIRSHNQAHVRGDGEDETGDEDEDVVFTGHMTKRPRREIENGPVSSASTPSSGPLRAISPRNDDGRCRSCGCDCNGQSASIAGTSGRSKGAGSQTLSNAIRGNIVELLVCPSQSLINQLSNAKSVRDWKDIAEIVGAKREDFDRVRHASKWLQDSLPALVRRGAL